MRKTAFVLILASDEAKGRALDEMLRDRWGHACRVVTTLPDALQSIRVRVPDVVVAVDHVDGDETLPALAETLAANAPDATLLGLGADGPPPEPPGAGIRFLALDNPSDDGELVDPIGAAAREAVGRREDRLLDSTVKQGEIPEFEGIVGRAPRMVQIVERIRKAARNKLTVLILGETGTGKDLIARAIHRQSDRAGREMKSLNCAGLTESLIESQLFGHVRGAFTGAVADRKGYFAAADGSTLFLDEIGDMPISMQAKLLRVLETREITPVGSTDVQRVDVRVIAATNADLRQRMDDHEFREDLYYRLHQWVIEIPPLRERREDVPLLAHHALTRANRAHGTTVPGFSNDALLALARYHWPGNVRELTNMIESVACEVAARRIEVDDLPEVVRGSRDIVPAAAGGIVGMTLAQMERLAIERTLHATGGNREQAAKMLGIGTRTLYRKIKEYGV